MQEETLKLYESTLGLDHPHTLTCRNNLANAYITAGRTGDAIRMHEETLKLCESKLGPDCPLTLASRHNLAETYESLGRWAEPNPCGDTLAHRHKTEKPESHVLADDLALLGMDLLNQVKWSEAETVLRECLAIQSKAIPDDWWRFNTMSMLGGALLGQGHFAEAEPLVLPGYEGMKAREAKIPTPGKTRLPEAAQRIVRNNAELG